MAAFWSNFVLVLLQWSGLSIWRSAQTAKIASTASTVVPQMITRTQIRRARVLETPSSRPGLAPAGLPAGVGGGGASADGAFSKAIHSDSWSFERARRLP